LQWHFHKNRSIILGYDYSRLEELFEFEALENISVSKQQVLVGQVVNSLVNQVVSEQHRDTSAVAQRYRKAVHYNKYRTQSLHLSYAQSVHFGKRSTVEFAVGGQWLIGLRSNAIGLLSTGGYKTFEETMSGRTLNLAYRLAAKYQYSIGNRTSLFARLAYTGYFNHWYYEREPVGEQPQQSAPINFGGSLGISQRF